MVWLEYPERLTSNQPVAHSNHAGDALHLIHLYQ